MHQDQIAWLIVGVLAVGCLVLCAVAVRERRAVSRERAHHEAALSDLRARLENLEDVERQRSPVPTVSEPAGQPEFVITGMPVERPRDATVPPSAPETPIDGAAFADTVLRETVVKAASLAHGVRRGLAPATRNRIRFEMRQEVKRARRQRKADLKQAQRDLHAHQRAMLTEEAEAS